MKSRLPGMLSEEFDKKIRDAAESHHPAYDEKAWKGMKRLLDKHMPEEKEDRRRFIFYLLFFLLLGGGAWYFARQSSAKKEKEKVVAVSSPNDKSPSPASDRQKDNVADQPIPVTNNDNSIGVTESVQDELVTTAPKKNNVREVITPVPKPAVVSNRVVNPGSKTIHAGGKIKQANSTLPPVTTEKQGEKSRDTHEVAVGVPSSDNKKDEPINDNKAMGAAGKRITSEPVVPGAVTKKEEAKTVPGISGDKRVNETEGLKKDKKPGKKRNSFSLSVSGGPDASFTGADKLGKMKWVGGIGMAYTFKERITLRTGFYSARKIYTSSPGEYHGSALFNTYYPNMQRIEADCKVYEIPLGISYHFHRADKQNIFASAGLSTYLMKRETYDYYYKYYPAAPTISREHTTRNKNNHYFSVLSVSAGYQRNISKRVSVTAEPYFKLPLKGVGEGKVKLNSTGLLFTLSVKPFKQPGK